MLIDDFSRIINQYSRCYKKEKNTTDKINVVDFADEIESIETSSTDSQEDLLLKYDVLNKLRENYLLYDEVISAFSLKTLNPNAKFLGYADRNGNFITKGGEIVKSEYRDNDQTMINPTNILDIGVIVEENGYLGMYLVTNDELELPSNFYCVFEYMRNRALAKAFAFSFDNYRFYSRDIDGIRYYYANYIYKYSINMLSYNYFTNNFQYKHGYEDDCEYTYEDFKNKKTWSNIVNIAFNASNDLIDSLNVS